MLALSKELSKACSSDAGVEKQIAEVSRSNANLRRDLLHSREERKKLQGSLDATELKIEKLTRQNTELRKVAGDREEAAADLQK